jgi:hypothetical protein
MIQDNQSVVILSKAKDLYNKYAIVLTCSKITDKAHNDMDKNKRKESYEPPKMEILEIMVEQAILQMNRLEDYEYGGAPFQ